MPLSGLYPQTPLSDLHPSDPLPVGFTNFITLTAHCHQISEGTHVPSECTRSPPTLAGPLQMATIWQWMIHMVSSHNSQKARLSTMVKFEEKKWHDDVKTLDLQSGCSTRGLSVSCCIHTCTGRRWRWLRAGNVINALLSRSS